MTDQPEFVRERTDMLDCLGNTTAATGKGFAIGSAALTALALFAAYVQVVQTQITTQAQGFIGNNSGGPAAAYVQYQGYHKFAIVDPTNVDEKGNPYVDGGMIVDRVQLAGMHFDEIVHKGQIFETVLPLISEHGEDTTIETARKFHIETAVGHGDHADTISLEIISSRNGMLQDVLGFYDVTVANPKLLGGLFIGVLLAFLFCALTMNAVGRAAYEMMGECRRQFGKMREAFRAQGMNEADVEDPMKWPKQVEFAGVHYADYARCVSISTAGA